MLLDERILMAHHAKNPERRPHQGPGPMGSWSGVGLDQSSDQSMSRHELSTDCSCVEGMMHDGRSLTAHHVMIPER